MGYEGLPAKKNFSPLLPLGGAGTGPGIVTTQKRSMDHLVSLTHFLLFCNQLPSKEIVGFFVEPRRGVTRL
jgi:hypothetical protein